MHGFALLMLISGILFTSEFAHAREYYGESSFNQKQIPLNREALVCKRIVTYERILAEYHLYENGPELAASTIEFLLEAKECRVILIGLIGPEKDIQTERKKLDKIKVPQVINFNGPAGPFLYVIFPLPEVGLWPDEGLTDLGRTQ